MAAKITNNTLPCGGGTYHNKDLLYRIRRSKTFKHKGDSSVTQGVFRTLNEMGDMQSVPFEVSLVQCCLSGSHSK